MSTDSRSWPGLLPLAHAISGICQEPQSPEWAFWFFQPLPDGTAAGRERGIESHSMAIRHAPRSTILAKDQDCADHPRTKPKFLETNLRGQASLDIQAAERFLDGAPFALCFAHKGSGRPFLRPEQVNGASLAVLGEGDLARSHPVVAAELLKACLDDSRMTAVHEPIQICTVPPDVETRTRVKGLEMAAELVELQAPSAPALDCLDDVARESGVRLAKACAATKQS